MNDFHVCSRGHECFPSFPTREEARAAMAEFVAEDMKRRKYLTKIRHNADHIEIKIGGRQSVSTWSEYWVVG